MLFPRGKDLFPNLTRYLVENVHRNQERKGRIAAEIVAWGICLAAIPCSVALLALPVFHSVLGLLAGGMATLFSIAFVFLTKTRWPEWTRPKTEAEQIHQAASDIGQAMLGSRRLHKQIDAAAAQLLEESARFRLEIEAILATPPWSECTLPAHWQSVRQQTLAAADQAMDELLVILRASFVPDDRRFRFENVIEDVIESFTGPRPMRAEHLPPGFAQARDIAEKLRMMLGEIDRATSQLSLGLSDGGVRRAGASLDSAISDIRSIQSAESELRQNLRN